MQIERKIKFEIFYLFIRLTIYSTNSNISKSFIDFVNYLSCIDIKQNYYNDDDFYKWFRFDILSHYNVFFVSRNVIIMNNVFIYQNNRFKRFIESINCRVMYFFFYFSNFNSIELSFFVLKIWIKRHSHEIWFYHENTFENFLKIVIKRNKCDK